ncbi:unnamed protein product [Penicillium roqueforti FM164]|uniref:Genomic scaffold, ProqFM164S02 n=1 Tax=Penicillium roqueforti (strain FM164) TaxID=1365484 RepID=W6QCN0_PENRF|nr:unnamed protein product [Penicillium roqueforti FM164]
MPHLSGRNHHALVDAQQLALMSRLSPIPPSSHQPSSITVLPLSLHRYISKLLGSRDTMLVVSGHQQAGFS